MTAETRFISCTDTAKLLRADLKEAFPGVKFSVRSKSYSGGASITVEWEDGPSEKEVEPACDRFAGSDFDSMQDLKVYRTSDLDGETVHFGADYIFTRRNLSGPFLQRMSEETAALYNLPPLQVTEDRGDNYILESGPFIASEGDELRTLIYRRARVTRAE